MDEQKKAFVNETLIGLRQQVTSIANTITRLLAVVNAAPPEDEEKDKPPTFGGKNG